MEKYKYLQNNCQRDYLFDTLKGVGILLVVFGHLIEQINTPITTFIYKIIYTFHMPLFIFIAGYFAKFNFKKILTQLVLPYLILQVIYTIAEIFILKPQLDILYILRPKWVLWFLFTLTIWKLSLLFIEKIKKFLPFIIPLFFIVGLSFGYLNFDGYILSISRLFVFYPFFLLGYYFKQIKLTDNQVLDTNWFKILFISLSLISLFLLFILFPHTPKEAFYGALNYYQLPYYNVLFRLMYYTTSFIIVFTLIIITTKSKNRLSFIGQQSFSLFIWHAPFAILLSEYLPLLGTPYSTLIAIPITVIMVFIIILVRKLCIKTNHNSLI